VFLNNNLSNRSQGQVGYKRNNNIFHMFLECNSTTKFTRDAPNQEKKGIISIYLCRVYTG
jgi:hypothetical protein